MTDYQEINESWNGHWTCPHCGSDNLDQDNYWYEDDYKYTEEKCMDCGAEILFTEVLHPCEVQWNPPEEPEEDDVETEVDEPVLDIQNAVVPPNVVEEISNILAQIEEEEISNILAQIEEEEGHSTALPDRVLIYTPDGNLRYPLMWERLQSLYDDRKRAIESKTRIRVRKGNGRRLTDEAIEQAVEEVLKTLKEVYEPRIARMKRFEEEMMEATNTITGQGAMHISADDTLPVVSPVPHAKYARIFHNLSPGS